MKGIPFQESKKRILEIYPGLRVCGCSCHKDGFELIHCMPCCDLCYDKFIYADGSVDYDRLKMHADDKALSSPRIKEPPKEIGNFEGTVRFPVTDSDFPVLVSRDIAGVQPMSSGEAAGLFHFRVFDSADDMLRE